jgi:seryl-tRNA synthetase
MVKKGITTKKSTKALSKKDLDAQLVENFVKLQKVMANLSVKFDNLSDNINKLLQLFEIAAKSFVKKQEVPGEDIDMLKKVDTLLEQNKTISNGLTLMEEKIRHKMEPGEQMPSLAPSHNEEELHGLYPRHGKPKPGFPNF